MNKETSEIAKLTERISKDPKSKLFVPLAEEYKKAGDIEMAIHVLSEGLKNNPGYVTARSVLGKLLLENGDLTASQKEFEEVVKAIPDNLMAQRKLGELYALQNRPDDALKHYKIVFSLNPRDAELASLISDLEAGRDVRPRLHQPKSQSSPDKSVKQEQQQAAPPSQSRPQAMPVRTPAVTAVTASAEPTPQAEVSAAEKVQAPEAGPALFQGKLESAIAAEAAPASAPLVRKEEPEEVSAVESLDAVVAGPEGPVSAFGFPAEKEQEIKTTPVEEEHAEISLPVSDQRREGPAVTEQGLAGGAIVQETAADEPQPVSAEIPLETDIGDIIETATVEKAPEASVIAETSENVSAEFLETIATEAPEEVLEKSDDFTTDTLAELYIAQGFYEKAIDIYQRMLADKPNSKGLKDKLERVRTMAAGATFDRPGPAEEAKEPKKIGEDFFAEPNAYAPPVEAEEVVIEAEVVADPNGRLPGKKPTEEKKEENIFAEPREYRPSAEWEEQPTAQRPGFDRVALSPSQGPARKGPSFPDFEPREYVPPKAEPGPGELKSGKMQVEPGPPKASKRETIDRLETWLRNIKKEK